MWSLRSTNIEACFGQRQAPQLALPEFGLVRRAGAVGRCCAPKGTILTQDPIGLYERRRGTIAQDVIDIKDMVTGDEPPEVVEQ